MAVQRIALIFGSVFVAVGLLGFVAAVTPDGKLLGVFAVNAAHNIVHLATGVVAIVAGMASGAASRVFFRIFGIVYAAVALLGLHYGEQPILGMVSNNAADIALHGAIALVALYCGFGNALTSDGAAGAVPRVDVEGRT